ncbi:hypothetical protein CQ12_40085 [Bradyrhizobium jicamae]|uniref:Uncharacterized protein n=1 Tax=Bradyrhizobium jicamae TaxID=280332 RepID=A0A0R3L6D1_9BRAD|nr:hypothetical protein CQ12_40085 [Bradyrhizobium jicamae]
MTFDIEKSHFVFERAGGNIITGEIISATDEQLDLSLRGAGGRILLSYNRKRNVVTWPGLPAGELGIFAMHHTCIGVAGRTMLSTFYQPEQLIRNVATQSIFAQLSRQHRPVFYHYGSRHKNCRRGK